MSLSHDELKLDKDQSNPMNTMLFSFALVSGVNSFLPNPEYVPKQNTIILQKPLKIFSFPDNHFDYIF